MKQLFFILISSCCSLMLSSGSLAQTTGNHETPRSITPYSISVGYHETSNLIFPYGIQGVDRGSAALLVQRAQGADNILQLKAARKGFTSTNLTVITTDGKFYSFLVDYAANPRKLNLSFVPEAGTVMLKELPDDEASFDTTVSVIRGMKRYLHLHERNQRVRLSLRGIYLYQGLMYLNLGIRNQSFIAYRPERIRFFFKDKRRSKRTAIQETELKPVYGTTEASASIGKTTQPIFAFSPFTIPDTKELVIQVTEKNGGRPLVLSVSHSVILRARNLDARVE